MSLPEALENAATALSQHADAVRDANGDPQGLLDTLSAGAASEVLGWLLSNEPDAGEELALAWSESEAGAEPLQELDGGALPKSGRKGLRKALHRLRTRGVELEATQQAPVVARLPEIDESIEAALVSPLDPRGSRMTYLVTSHATGGARIYEALLDDLRGIVEFRVYDTGRSKARKFLRELSERANASMLEVSPAMLCALLVRAAKRQPADRPAPRAFAENRSQLGLDTASSTPGEEVVAALGEPTEADAAALARLAEQAKEGRLGPWPPPVEKLRSVAEQVREGISGKLIVSGTTERERTHDVLERAAAEIYDENFAQVTADRLRETAFISWRSGREDEARECLAGAAAFASGAHDNPVARAFVEAILAPLLAELASEDAAQEESSLLVKP